MVLAAKLFLSNAIRGNLKKQRVSLSLRSHPENLMSTNEQSIISIKKDTVVYYDILEV